MVMVWSIALNVSLSREYWWTTESLVPPRIVLGLDGSSQVGRRTAAADHQHHRDGLLANVKSHGKR